MKQVLRKAGLDPDPHVLPGPDPHKFADPNLDPGQKGKERNE